MIIIINSPSTSDEVLGFGLIGREVKELWRELNRADSVVVLAEEEIRTKNSIKERVIYNTGY